MIRFKIYLIALIISNSAYGACMCAATVKMLIEPIPMYVIDVVLEPTTEVVNEEIKPKVDDEKDQVEAAYSTMNGTSGSDYSQGINSGLRTIVENPQVDTRNSIIDVVNSTYYNNAVKTQHELAQLNILQKAFEARNEAISQRIEEKKLLLKKLLSENNGEEE